ncbi:MAG: LON peptidase substrate-binding domain-containing protein [Ferruginibacter sp.]|nr:LON peptidase substrate-binding domain-containing protein [Cytophagales bacterium]
MLPLFPLNLVVYPNEKLNLHVFEPRYRQLVDECLEQQSTFGISAFINNRLEDYGTEMQILSLEKKHEDGRMDIRTEGVRVFHLLRYDNPAADKLYAGGVVDFVESNEEPAPAQLTAEVLNKLGKLYFLLQLKLDVAVERVQNLSYEIAHKIGLSVEQEYEVLTLATETARQQYLLGHLERVIPIVADMEKTKERVRMNGYFKSFDPLNF